MVYILNEISDIESLLLEDLDEVKVFGDTYPPRLPYSSNAIKQSISCFKIISIGDQSDREALLISEYNANDKKHFCIVNYSTLEKLLDYDKFREELSFNVNLEQKNYLRELHENVESGESNFKSMQHIRESFDEVVSAEEDLKSVFKKANPIQQIVLKIYRDSYIDARRNMVSCYTAFYPQLFESRESVESIEEERYFKSADAYQKFLRFERKLQQKDFLSQERKWLKSKADLVRYYLFCKDLDLYGKWAIMDGKTDAIKMLEDIYNCDLKTMRRPSKQNYDGYKDNISSLSSSPLKKLSKFLQGLLL